MRKLYAVVSAFIILSGAAFAQSDPAELAENAAAQLEAAHNALNDASGARNRVAALTQTIKAYENGLNAMREGLRRATLRQAAIRKKFDSESEQVSRLLGVLYNIQSASGPLVLLHPSGPLGTARSGIIVSEIAPAIQKEAAALRVRLEEIALLRALQETAADTLSEGLKGVQQARTDLSQAVSNRTDLPQRLLSDPSQIQRLIDSTETLSGFASGLSDIEFTLDETTQVQGFDRAKGALDLPVLGNLLRGYNEPDAAGIKRTGLLIATRPLSIVTTPWPATLRYRGPLLDYGNVMILEPAPDTLLILSGMDEVYGEIGQVLPPAAVVGLMGGTNPNADTFLLEAVNGTGSDLTETLYIELRVGGEPVDPTQWFAQTKE